MTSKFLRSMYNKTIIRFGFCDIQNNQGLGKGYQPQPSASADNPYLDLDYSGYHKTSSNNCLKADISRVRVQFIVFACGSNGGEE